MLTKIMRKITLSAVLALTAATPAWGAPGDPYPAWGFLGSGQFIVSYDLGGNLNDTAADSAVGEDGSLYLAGTVTLAAGVTRIGVAKLTPEGGPDNSFSGDGKAISGMSNVVATSMALSPTYIYVAGYRTENAPDYDMVVCRFARASGLNAAFPNNGNSSCVSPDALPGTQDIANDIVVLPDGKFVVAGTMGDSPDATYAAFARFESDGQRDNTFGSDPGSNIALIRDDSTYARHTIHALARTSNGDLAGVGSTRPIGQAGDSALIIRLDEDGNDTLSEFSLDLDNSLSRDTVLRDVVPLDIPGEDDQLIVAGHAELTSNKNSGLLARITGQLDGLDTLFGENVGFTLVTPSVPLEFTDVALEPGGGIVTLGLLHSAAGDVLDVRRFAASGERDNEFGNAGSTQIDFNLAGNFHGTAALSVRGDAAYIAGWALQNDVGNTDFVAAKLLTGNFMFKDGFEGF